MSACPTSQGDCFSQHAGKWAAYAPRSSVDGIHLHLLCGVANKTGRTPHQVFVSRILPLRP